MSRSFSATSFTTRPPIRMVPAVSSSEPRDQPHGLCRDRVVARCRAACGNGFDMACARTAGRCAETHTVRAAAQLLRGRSLARTPALLPVVPEERAMKTK